MKAGFTDGSAYRRLPADYRGECAALGRRFRLSPQNKRVRLAVDSSRARRKGYPEGESRQQNRRFEQQQDGWRARRRSKRDYE